MFTPEELELLDSYPDDDEEEALEAPDLENLGLENDDVKGREGTEGTERNGWDDNPAGEGEEWDVVSLCCDMCIH